MHNMVMKPRIAPTPQAFAALEPFPALRAAVAESLARQQARVARLCSGFVNRPRLIAALEAAVSDPHGGVVALTGPPGSGVSSLLAVLSARHPWPIWLPTVAPTGVAALYAQFVALYRPAIPLLDPAALTDPLTFERLFTEVTGLRKDNRPIVWLCDTLDAPGQPLYPGPPPLPPELPPGVTLLLGSLPNANIPYSARVRVQLPEDDPDLHAVEMYFLRTLNCPSDWIEALIGAAEGNMLYLRLAFAALRTEALTPRELPLGLNGLLRNWWARLTPPERRLATLLAAAAEPLPLSLAAELTGSAVDKLLARWERLELIDLITQAAPSADEGTPETPVVLVQFAHDALSAFVGRVAPEGLMAAHADLALLAVQRLEQEAERRGEIIAANVELDYLQRQYARHGALGGARLSQEMLDRVVSREWIRAQERRGSLVAALDDARWALRTAIGGPALRQVRAALLTGLLATQSRSLPPEAAAAALVAGLEHGGREPALKRVLDIVERLPDGYAKALVLRSLGEVCYAARMRSAAMRLLSRALDLEANPVSRAWRDGREALLAALANAALTLHDIETALAIAERIEHLERRAMVETEAVRQMLAAGDYDHAQRLARAILHEGMGAWAKAEVAVAMIRQGDPRGAMLLEEIESETVTAWAQIELACDEVVHDEAAARRRIAALPSQHQRDRGLARLARTLAAAGDEGAALAAAEAIVGVHTRVAALIELRLSLEGLVAMLALERATRDIGALSAEDRAPLVADLAAALAALGRLDRALEVARSLPEGEERERALARVAVTLAQIGEHESATEILAMVSDEDERAWAYEELARQRMAAGQWESAKALIESITVEAKRARAMADLAIAWVRAGDPIAALALARSVPTPTERTRALILMAPELVAQGAERQALAIAGDPEVLTSAEARARYQATLAIALAEHGRLDVAAIAVAGIRRPAERARAGMALARALAPHHPQRALAAMGEALRSAVVGRDETLRALEWAAPVLATLGGADLLREAAAAVDEIDRWL